QGVFKRSRQDIADGEQTESKHVSFRVRDIKPEKPRKDAPIPSGTDLSRIPSAAQPRRKEDLEEDIPPSAQPVSSSQQPPPPSSQRSSSQPSQQKSLGFPHVKDPYDPDTALRLSQRDDLGHISHQGSQQNGSQKGGSFISEISNDASTSTSKSGSSTKPLSSKEARPRIDSRFATRYAGAFDTSSTRDTFVFGLAAPTYKEVEATTEPQVIYQDAYYSNEKDVPERPREYAGQEFRLESTTLPFLQPFDPHGEVQTGKGTVIDKPKSELEEQRRRKACSLRSWEIMKPPPTFSEVQEWLHIDNANEEGDELDTLEVDGPPQASQIKRKNRPAAELSQIEGPTQKNNHGFKYSQRKASTSVQHETGYMSTMALEVHANSRNDLAPDPERDEVGIVFWCLADEQLEGEESQKTGVVLLDKDDNEAHITRIRKIFGNNVEVDTEDNELDLLNRVVDIVR
ncbi:hypothetical protein KC353_g20615, partial [Hortaea werneckii]